MSNGSANWPALDKSTKYLIDTDVLAHIQQRKDSKSIYDGIIGQAALGKLKTVRQVFDELKRHKTQHAILSPHRKDFEVPIAEQMTEAVSEIIDWLQKNTPWLCAWTGAKNPDPADPWLIAVGKVYGYTLVTNESAFSSVKIPHACKLPHVGCRCINGAHYLLEVGVVTEMKPEHISWQAFFSGN
jgi:hypothetical protein